MKIIAQRIPVVGDRVLHADSGDTGMVWRRVPQRRADDLYSVEWDGDDGTGRTDLYPADQLTVISRREPVVVGRGCIVCGDPSGVACCEFGRVA